MKEGKRFGLSFWKLHDTKRGTTKAFGSYKVTSKLCLIYLELQLQQDRRGWRIYQLNCHKPGETMHLEAYKQQIKYCWCFKDVEKVKKR